MSWLMELVADRWHYAAVLLFCLAVTAPLELVIGARVWRRPRRLAFALSGAVPFLLWDVWFVDAGHWWFADEHVTGVDIGSLPIEEIAFFVVIPICGLLTYEAVGAIVARWRAITTEAGR